MRGDCDRPYRQLAAHVSVGAARGAAMAGERGAAAAPARGAHRAAAGAARPLRPAEQQQ